jgi:hypothetical protein
MTDYVHAEAGAAPARAETGAASVMPQAKGIGAAIAERSRARSQ